MTTTTELSQEEKRAKIAEACGWKGTAADFTFNPEGNLCYGIPDYFNDLNAMHQAEQWMFKNTAFRNVYVDVMFREAWSAYDEVPNYDPDTIAAVICASPALRAEAFGRTLNLWE